MHIGMTTSRTRWLWLLLAASPAVVPLVWVYQYGVNFHYWDEWAPDIGPMLVKAHQHQLTLADLFAQHNEHRILIPRLFLVLLTPLTHWNNIANLLFEWVILCATSLVVLGLCRRTAGDPAEPDAGRQSRGVGGGLLLWFLCNLLIFTPAQHENLLWGMGLVNVMPSFFVLLSILAARWALPPWTKLLICMLLATAASYSSGNGFLAWPLAGLVFFSSSRGSAHSKTPMLLIWIAGFAASAALYAYHYLPPPHRGSHPYTANLLTICLYNLAFVGVSLDYGPADSWPGTAILCGDILCTLLGIALIYFLHCRRHAQRPLCDRMILWLAVGAYGIFSGSIAALFRAGFGPPQALSSRYVTYAIYVPIALINLLPMIAQDLRQKRALGRQRLWVQLPVLLAAVMIVLEVLAFGPAIRDSRSTRLSRRLEKAALLLVNLFPHNPQLGFVFYEPWQLPQQANALNQIGYLQPPLVSSDIAQKDAGQAAKLRGRIQHPGSPTSPPAGAADITVTGWAIDGQTHQPADAVVLTYDNEDGQSIIFTIARTDLPRYELAQDDPARLSGFSATISLDRLPPQPRSLRIAAWALDSDTAKLSLLDGAFTLQR